MSDLGRLSVGFTAPGGEWMWATLQHENLFQLFHYCIVLLLCCLRNGLQEYMLLRSTACLAWLARIRRAMKEVTTIRAASLNLPAPHYIHDKQKVPRRCLKGHKACNEGTCGDHSLDIPSDRSLGGAVGSLAPPSLATRPVGLCLAFLRSVPNASTNLYHVET